MWINIYYEYSIEENYEQFFKQELSYDIFI